jgi:hypothetical protein
VTLETGTFDYGVVHAGDHHLHCGVATHQSQEVFAARVAALTESFAGGDLNATVRRLESSFGHPPFAQRSLFKDQRVRVVQSILGGTLADVESKLLRIYDDHAVLMRYLKESDLAVPRSLRLAAELALGAKLREMVEAEEVDVDRIAGLLQEMTRSGVVVNELTMRHALEGGLQRAVVELCEEPEAEGPAERLLARVELLQRLPFVVDLGRAQLAVLELGQERRAVMRERGAKGDGAAQEWMARLEELGEKLRVVW